MAADTVATATGTIAVRRIRTIQKAGRVLRLASYALSLATILIKERKRTDVIYARFLNEGAAVAALLRRLKIIKSPLVAVPANVHGAGDVNALLKLPAAGYVVKLLNDECSAINLIASAMEKELTAAGFSASKFSRIPNGIPIRAWHAKQHTGSPTYLTVGRLTQQKGIDILLNALSMVREDVRPGQFRIIGDGPEMSRLQALSKELGVGDAVEWLGELPPNAIDEELERADIFLLPSRYEGMSNAGLEAMERGKALLITQCGGLDRHIGVEHGWLAEPGDAASLAQALVKSLHTDGELLHAMGKATRMTAITFFDMDLVAVRYIELFRRLLSENEGPAGDGS